MPIASVAASANSAASTKDPVHPNAAVARYAPTMYSEPWARLTRFMMPKTSVRPAASKNSMTPNCRPLRTCSTTRSPVNAGSALPLHRALLVVGVLVVLEDGLLDLHLDLAARALHRLQEVEVLDRRVVRIVGELAPRRLEVGLAHRGDHALLVAEVALHAPYRRIDQENAVVA